MKFLSCSPSSQAAHQRAPYYTAVLCMPSVWLWTRADRQPRSIEGVSCSWAFPPTAGPQRIVALSKFKQLSLMCLSEEYAIPLHLIGDLTFLELNWIACIFHARFSLCEENSTSWVRFGAGEGHRSYSVSILTFSLQACTLLAWKVKFM